MRVLDTHFPRTYHHSASCPVEAAADDVIHPGKEGSMRDTLRSIAILLAVLGAVAGPGFAAPAKAAGERDVTVAQCIDAEFLDVQMTNNIVTLIINTSIYDTLLTRDKQLQLVPNLALSYKLVSENLWEVKLRQGVKFHNGEPFDANAVKFSFERINLPDPPREGTEELPRLPGLFPTE
jgi:ABC-type transport system substrate-binding protein